jgi:predicted ribonuclease YlaK
LTNNFVSPKHESKSNEDTLTRIGDNSKFIISGDLDQSDRFRHYHQSGLYDTINTQILMRLVWLCLVMKILLEIK